MKWPGPDDVEQHEPELWTNHRDPAVARVEIPAEVCGSCSRATGQWVPASFCDIAKLRMEAEQWMA